MRDESSAFEQSINNCGDESSHISMEDETFFKGMILDRASNAASHYEPIEENQDINPSAKINNLMRRKDITFEVVIDIDDDKKESNKDIGVYIDFIKHFNGPALKSIKHVNRFANFPYHLRFEGIHANAIAVLAVEEKDNDHEINYDRVYQLTIE